MITFSTPTDIIQNLARSKAYLKRDELLRAIETMLDGLKAFEPKKLLGKARFEIEVQIGECLMDLNRSPKLMTLLQNLTKSHTAKVAYKSGDEQTLIQVLTVLHKALDNSENNKKMEAREKTDARRKDLWEKGTAFLSNGDAPRARSIFRRLGDEFGHEEDVLLNIGKKFLEAKLYFEAQEFMQQALTAFPKQGQIYTYLISCNTAMNEMEKVEKIYEAAIKQFGRHPRTLLNLARFYLNWNKRDKAAEQALAVLQIQPDNAEAKELFEKAEKRPS